MIDNFYSRYTSMTGEENPNRKPGQPNYKLTTMIKDPNALTAEHSLHQGKSDRLQHYSINDFDEAESLTSEQGENRMLEKIGFGARAPRAAPLPSFKLPAQKAIAKSNRISLDNEQVDQVGLQFDEKPDGRASELITRMPNITYDEDAQEENQ